MVPLDGDENIGEAAEGCLDGRYPVWKSAPTIDSKADWHWHYVNYTETNL
jgi:hypothetical protein